MSKSRARLATAEQELSEIRRRDANDRALKRKADGLPIKAPIREAHRYDWARRYTAATEAAEDTEEDLEVSLVAPFVPVPGMSNVLFVLADVKIAVWCVGLEPPDPECNCAEDFRGLRFRFTI